MSQDVIQNIKELVKVYDQSVNAFKRRLIVASATDMRAIMQEIEKNDEHYLTQIRSYVRQAIQQAVVMKKNHDAQQIKTIKRHLINS